MEKRGKKYIYALIDPLDNKVRYIGQTYNVTRRFSEHKREALNQTRTKKDKWIVDVIKRGRHPCPIVLEEVKKEDSDDKEKKWIRYYKSKGVELVNTSRKGLMHLHNDFDIMKIEGACRKPIYEMILSKYSLRYFLGL